MIDFNKPMRVRGGEDLYESAFLWKVMLFRGTLVAVGDTGVIVPLTKPIADAVVENIPEPKRRYQAQYTEGASGPWWNDKKPELDMVIAWLIETDHGEGAVPRYTYEREDVRQLPEPPKE